MGLRCRQPLSDGRGLCGVDRWGPGVTQALRGGRTGGTRALPPSVRTVGTNKLLPLRPALHPQHRGGPWASRGSSPASQGLSFLPTSPARSLQWGTRGGFEGTKTGSNQLMPPWAPLALMNERLAGSAGQQEATPQAAEIRGCGCLSPAPSWSLSSPPQCSQDGPPRLKPSAGTGHLANLPRAPGVSGAHARGQEALGVGGRGKGATDTPHRLLVLSPQPEVVPWAPSFPGGAPSRENAPSC